MTKVLNHHARAQLVGVLLLGGCALGACSGDDQAAIGQSNLGSDASSDATTADDGDDAPEMGATTTPPDGAAVAEAEADAFVDAVADGGSADAAPDSDGSFDAGDGGDEHDGSHPDAGDAGDGRDAADAAGDGGHEGGVVSEGGADGGDAGDGGAVGDAGDGGAGDAGDGGVDGGAGDAGDGGLSMTAKIILDTQGADCEACAVVSCLGPAATCEAFSGQVADGGAMSGTSMAVLCDQTLSCILDSTPTVPCYDQGAAPLSCYCGVENQTVCRTSGPTATAQCVSQEQNGFETQDPATIVSRVENTAYPSGMANAILDCIGSNCASCLQ